MNRRIRMLCTLAGDIERQPEMKTKYLGLLNALDKRFEIVQIFDANLRGVARYWNALQTFRPSIQTWKQHFFRNVPSFEMRSRLVQRQVQTLSDRVDVVLQLGALFDSTKSDNQVPVVLYTDNTTYITYRHSKKKMDMPLWQTELAEWLAREKQLYQRAAHICVRSKLVKESLLSDYGVDPEVVTVIGGGVNFDILPSTFGRPNDRPLTVLFIGQKFLRKGGDLVLQAFARARSDMPDIRMLMVTGDPIPDGLSLDGVEVLPLNWDRNVIASLYTQAHILILPSRHETWGDVLLEAMAFGLPCIGVSGQAMEEIILHDETGFIVQPENVDALSHAIIRLLGQPELRLRMGQMARSQVNKKYTWDLVAGRLADAVQKVVI